MDTETREGLAEGLRRAADLLSAGMPEGNDRREILRACDTVRAAFVGMGFDEGSSRKRVVGFLRSVALANGVIGKRTAHRLCHRTFEEDGDAAEKWLLERGLLEDQGSEGFALSDEGASYLEQHKAEFAAPHADKQRRPDEPRRRSSSRPRDSRDARGPSNGKPAAASVAPEDAPASGEA